MKSILKVEETGVQRGNWFVQSLTTRWKQGQDYNAGVQPSFMCVFQEVTVLSKPIAVTLHRPDRIKQSGFAVFTYFLRTRICSSCVYAS